MEVISCGNHEKVFVWGISRHDVIRSIKKMLFTTTPYKCFIVTRYLPIDNFESPFLFINHIYDKLFRLELMSHASVLNCISPKEAYAAL